MIATILRLIVLLFVYPTFDVYGFVFQKQQVHSCSRRRSNPQALSSSDINTNDSVSACPFSKAYPRYRIDLTIPKRRQERLQQNTFFSNLQTTWQKSKFESQYKDENAMWIEEARPVDIFTSLWKWTTELMEKSQGQRSIVLGYPNDKDGVVQRWIDIVEWQFKDESGLETVRNPQIKATILSKDSQKTPTVVRLECPEGMQHHVLEEVNQQVMEARMKSWVKRILVDLSICPFTKSVTKSGQGLGDLGIPVGRIAYHSSSGSPQTVYRLMADTWDAISKMLKAGPSGKEGISSILLAAPYCDDDFDTWSGPIFAMLEASVVACRAEKEIGVVCFHPKYATPDGSSFPGFGHMHSVPRLQKWVKEISGQDMDPDLVAAGGAWQRRTPHATINVLRADQLEAAEGRRSSGKMYTENICKLVGEPDGIGSSQLADYLQRERQIGE